MRGGPEVASDPHSASELTIAGDAEFVLAPCSRTTQHAASSDGRNEPNGLENADATASAVTR
jgi:hypothetical protein